MKFSSVAKRAAETPSSTLISNLDTSFGLSNSSRANSKGARIYLVSRSALIENVPHAKAGKVLKALSLYLLSFLPLTGAPRDMSGGYVESDRIPISERIPYPRQTHCEFSKDLPHMPSTIALSI